MKNFIKCFDCINTLMANHIISDKEYQNLKNKLLICIINYFEKEAEDEREKSFS